ncbi:hypothetical protein M3J09_001646 [Ascochyta lentis]
MQLLHAIVIAFFALGAYAFPQITPAPTLPPVVIGHLPPRDV